MNILFTKFPLESHFGGGEHHTIQLAEGLTARGHSIFLLSSDPILLKAWQDRGWSHQELWICKEPTSPPALVEFFVRRSSTQRILIQAIEKLQKKYAFTAVYSQSLTEKLLLPPLAAKLGLRQFWMEHVQPGNWLLKNPFRSLYIKNATQFATVLTVSHPTAEEYLRVGVPKNHMQVIYNGVDTNALQPLPISLDDPLRLVGVGRLEPEKGFDTAIQTAALLQEEGVDFKLDIIGAGSQEEALRQQISELKLTTQVHLLGFQKDVPKLVTEHDLFFLLSRKESFGIAVAEAAALGRPAVVSDISGLNEVVKEGETGLHVPVDNPKAAAGVIIELVKNRQKIQTMGTAAREYIVQNFSLETMISAYEKLFSGQ